MSRSQHFCLLETGVGSCKKTWRRLQVTEAAAEMTMREGTTTTKKDFAILGSSFQPVSAQPVQLSLPAAPQTPQLSCTKPQCFSILPFLPPRALLKPNIVSEVSLEFFTKRIPENLSTLS